MALCIPKDMGSSRVIHNLVYSYFMNHMIPAWVQANHRPNQEALEEAESYWTDAKKRLVQAQQAVENSSDAAAKKNLERVEKQVKVYGYRVRDVYGPRAAKTRGGSDYASYHYAVHEAYLHGDPYAMELDHRGIGTINGDTDLSGLRPWLRQQVLEHVGSEEDLERFLMERFGSPEELATASFIDIKDAFMNLISATATLDIWQWRCI